MYCVEPRRKLPADICRPDYIQPIDYLRPLAGGTFLSLVVFCFANLITAITKDALVLSTILLSPAIYLSSVVYAYALLISAWSIHLSWLKQLQDQGPESYIRHINVQVPKRQAFELCLAAVGQMTNPRITGFNEGRGRLQAHTSGNGWTEDYEVDIHITESADGMTRIRLSAHIYICDANYNCLRWMWGDKWMPLVLMPRRGQEGRQKLLDAISDFITRHPRWSYEHVIGGYEPNLDMIAEKSA